MADHIVTSKRREQERPSSALAFRRWVESHSHAVPHATFGEVRVGITELDDVVETHRHEHEVWRFRDTLAHRQDILLHDSALLRAYCTTYVEALEDHRALWQAWGDDDGQSEDAKKVAALEKEVAELRAELERSERQRTELHSRLQEMTAASEALVNEAAGNSAAMFTLSKVVEATKLNLRALAENLTAPSGWVAFAQLWRAGLIGRYGDIVVPTDSGVQLIRWLLANMEEPEPVTVPE